MKKVVKFFVLSISVIALFGCKKEGQAKTGSAMNEIYGYWLVFDTSDRREKRDDIDYSTHFTKEENDSNIKKDSDTAADYSKKNMKSIAKYGDRYRAKYVNNDVICLREKENSETISYHYFKKIDSDTMIEITLYDDIVINRLNLSDVKLIAISSKHIFKRVSKLQFDEFMSAKDDNDKFVMEEYERIRKNTLNKNNMNFYRKYFSGWFSINTDNGIVNKELTEESLYGRYTKLILDDFHKNPKVNIKQ